ncbi:MAG: DUF4915 domain-containing protein [Bacillota bacterium]
MWIEWPELERKIAERDYILFGAGIWADKTIKRVTKKPLYILDNNSSKNLFKNINVKHPEDIKKTSEDTIIIITTGSVKDVANQLENLGYERGNNFFVSPALLNQKITRDIKTNDQTLLFTCSDSKSSTGGIYTFDIQERSLEKHYSGRFHEIVKTDNFYYIVEEEKGVLVLDKDLNLIETYEQPDESLVYGITYNKKENLLYLVNTYQDLIYIFDLNKKDYKDTIYISRKNKGDEVTRHHLNDICYYKGSLYVSMFSFAGMWRNGIYDGGVAKINPRTKEIDGHIIEDLWLPHSIDFVNEKFVICDSMRGDVYKTTNKILANFKGFIRGLAHDGKYYYIGQSEHRYFERLKDVTTTIDLNCGIHVFDEFTKSNRFYTFENLRNIHSIEILD